MRIVQALDHGLQILEILAKADGAVGVTQIATQLGLDKSSVYRLLTTLQERRYVEKDEHSRYRLSYKAIQVGIAALDGMQLSERAKPFLEELVRCTGETAHLARLIQGRIIYIARLESPNPVTVSTEVGGEAPAHASATGKAIMAFLPSEELCRFLGGASDLERYTPRTLVDPEMLKRHLQAVRKQGYAIDDEERFVGVRCVAAPVFDYRGQVIASIGISGPAHRIPMERLDEFYPSVVEMAAQVSEASGYRYTG